MKWLLIVLSLWLRRSSEDDDAKYWCWTKPAEKKDNKKWDLSKGGPNWGFCSDPAEALSEKLEYKVTVFTSNIEGAGAKGVFKLKMFGDEGQTTELQLTSDGFQQGQANSVKISASRIGDPFKIILRNEGKDSFRCQYVRIAQGTKFWDFDCGEWLQCPKRCQEEMDLRGSSKYLVNIRTKGEASSGTKAPLFIKLMGTKGETKMKILTEYGFKKGSDETIELLANDIGDLCAIKLQMMQHDDYEPDAIKVTKSGGKEKEFKDIDQKLMCPMKCDMILKAKCEQEGAEGKKKPKKKKKKKSGGGGGGKKGRSDKDDSGSDQGSGDDDESDEEEEQIDPNSIFNMYYGQGLTLLEKIKLIKIGCDTIVKDNDDFGKQFMDERANHELYIVQCPYGCDTFGDSKPLGMGIHPEESSICKSAIIDNSMTLMGGIVGVGTYKGIGAYMKNEEKIYGLEVEAHKQSQKSYTTIKIDNVDMADLDLRILNHKGQPAYMGRVEFRLDGQWGTLCNQGMTSSAARRICRDLKYKDGLLVGQDEEGACKMIEGENYCGYGSQYIHFQGLNCEGNEQNIMQCYRELATDQCTHDNDVIVECSSINFDKEQPPVDKTIRLVDEQGGASSTGSGRLEIYMGKWGTICNFEFDDNSAKVACLQMGFDNGKLIGDVDETGVCTNFNDKDFCGKDNQPIQMSNVKCKGDEAKLDQCPFIARPKNCGHNQDVIISCDGLKGDATGKSQQPKIVVNPPQMGKLPLIPIIKSNCGMNFQDAIFRGDRGSIFLLHCPGGCTDAQGSVYGTAVYSAESSICKSAIHAGVVQDYGGLVEVVKLEGQDSYEGSMNRDITSVDFEKSDVAFCVTKPNSLAVRLAQSFQGRDKVKVPCYSCGRSFIQKSIAVKYRSIVESRNTNTTVDFNRNRELYRQRVKRMNQHKLYTDQQFFRFYQDYNESLRKQDQMFPHFLESNSNLDLYLKNPQHYYQLKEKESQKKLNKKLVELSKKFKQRMDNVLRFRTVYDNNQYRSFLQLKFFDKLFKKGAGDGLVFQWYPEPMFEFNGMEDDIQQLIGLPGEAKTGSLRDFSIATKFMLQRSSDEELTIVSHSACGGYALTMTSDHQLVFKKRCGKEFIFNSNYFVPLKTPISVVVLHSMVKTSIYINGELYNYVMAGSLFTCNGNLDIGAFGDQKNQIWIGSIYYVRIYDIQLSVGEIVKLFVKGAYKPPSGQLKGPRHTIDGRLCTKECTANPHPGQLGAPGAPQDAQLGQPEKTDPDQNTDEGMPDDAQIGKKKDGESDEEDFISTAILLTCKNTMSDPGFEGATGKQFRVQCPANCEDADSPVLGTMIYTDNSGICRSAIHAGFINNKGGEMIMQVANGEPFYQDSFQNNIQSGQKLQNPRSMVFKKALRLYEIGCETTAQDPRFSGPVNTKFSVKCAPFCSVRQVNLYGTNIFSDDSSICQAGIHYGVLGDQGGELQIQIQEGQRKYVGSSSNGITSLKKDSFIRSFVVIGDKSNACKFFEEKYVPTNIFENWNIVDADRSEKGPSDWSFNTNPDKPNLLAIEQLSLIKGKGSYGTSLLHKSFECPNALYKVNVYFKQLAKVGLLFRYRDRENYMAVYLNEGSTPLKLVKMMNGEYEELMSLGKMQFLPEIWYRFRIYYNNKQIKVYYQTHFVRQIQLLMSFSEDDIFRGTVGVSVDNTDSVYFDGLSTEEANDLYIEKGQNYDKKRSWNTCMGADKVSKRKSFCSKFYGGYVEGFKKCMEVHRYCIICCDKLIDSKENILNFACLRGCINDAQAQKKAEQLKKLEELEKLKKLRGDWMPTEGEKVDFKKDDQKTTPWTKGIIKKINKEDLENFIFDIETSEGMFENIPQSKNIVKKCGTALEGRQDCV